MWLFLLYSLNFEKLDVLSQPCVCCPFNKTIQSLANLSSLKILVRYLRMIHIVITTRNKGKRRNWKTNWGNKLCCHVHAVCSNTTLNADHAVKNSFYLSHQKTTLPRKYNSEYCCRWVYVNNQPSSTSHPFHKAILNTHLHVLHSALCNY